MRSLNCKPYNRITSNRITVQPQTVQPNNRKYDFKQKRKNSGCDRERHRY